MADIYLRTVPSDADPDDLRLRDPTVADGGGSVVGTLSATLGALLLAATGLVTVGGTGGATFDALTLSATGTVVVAGTSSQALEGLSLTGTGTVSTGSVADTMLLLFFG